jgi:RNA polymerase sigma-70 factor, ECF subfamily
MGGWIGQAAGEAVLTRGRRAEQIRAIELRGYFQAAETGEMTPLMNLLSENVVLWTDGGGKTVTAALRPIHGREAVARLSLAAKRFWPESYSFDLKEVNGQAALVFRVDEQAWSVLTVDVEQEQIQTIRIIANPEKLTRV